MPPYFGLLLVVATGSLEAAEIFHCRAYSGGEFWSSRHCNHQQASLLRIVTVPDGMTFEQQVQLGEQARQQGENLQRAANQPPAVSIQRPQGSANPAVECGALDNYVRQLDAMARQPQNAQSQDRITQERKRVRDRQVQLRCR
jgi:hypothetical protein